MSDLPPPPPPTGNPPPGYVMYGATPPTLQQPRGLRVATLVGFAAVTVFCFVLGAVAYARGGLLDDYFAGTATLADLQESDDQVQRLAVLFMLFQVGAAVLLAIWSHRTTKNALARDPYLNASAKMAAGGWFIPFGNFVLPWKHLRTACTAQGGKAPTALNLWQFAFCAELVFGRVASGMGELDLSASRSKAIDQLHQQGIYFLVTAAILVIAGVAAFVAMPKIDSATSGVAAA